METLGGHKAHLDTLAARTVQGCTTHQTQTQAMHGGKSAMRCRHSPDEAGLESARRAVNG